jgi:hypothetical protein
MPEAAIPQPASTVVLLRPNANTGFDVYLNRRPDHLDTYAGVFVFPGGRVEESDCSAATLALTRGLSPFEAQQKLGVSLPKEICLGYWVAAVRELFEEVGIHFLLCGPGTADSSSDALYQRMAERISPQLALERFAQNEFPMMPPTVMVLRSLAKYRSWTELRELLGVC